MPSTDKPLVGDRGQQQVPATIQQDVQTRSQRRPQQSFLPPELMDIVAPSLKVGAGAGEFP
jgi:hypothetical protein